MSQALDFAVCRAPRLQVGHVGVAALAKVDVLHHHIADTKGEPRLAESDPWFLSPVQINQRSDGKFELEFSVQDLDKARPMKTISNQQIQNRSDKNEQHIVHISKVRAGPRARIWVRVGIKTASCDT